MLARVSTETGAPSRDFIVFAYSSQVLEMPSLYLHPTSHLKNYGDAIEDNQELVRYVSSMHAQTLDSNCNSFD